MCHNLFVDTVVLVLQVMKQCTDWLNKSKFIQKEWSLVLNSGSLIFFLQEITKYREVLGTLHLVSLSGYILHNYKYNIKTRKLTLQSIHFIILSCVDLYNHHHNQDMT